MNVPADHQIGPLDPALRPTETPVDISTCLRALPADQTPLGGIILKRRLSGREVSILRDRRDVLSRAQRRGTASEIARAVGGMLLGFGGRSMTAKEAAAVATTYVQALEDVPLWAVMDACRRFAAGKVTAEEIEEARIDRSFAPSSAQVAMVARKLADPFALECVKIGQLLLGKVREDFPEPTAEERERVSQKLTALAGSLKSMSDPDGQDAASRARREAESREASQIAILREYHAHGVEPPAANASGMIPSMPMLLKMGWTIRLVDGRRVIAGPQGVRGEFSGEGR